MARRGIRPGIMELGGERWEFQDANEILIKTAEWLVQRGKLTASRCPIDLFKRREVRYLIHSEPTHKHGRDFFHPMRLSNGLWLEIHYGAHDCEEYAGRLLQECGLAPGILKVERIEW